MTTSATRPRDDPAVLAEGVRRGEPAKVARMLSLVEAGDDTGARRDRVADRRRRSRVHDRHHRRAGCRQVLAHRSLDHASCARWATRWRCSRSTRRAHGPAVPSSVIACAWALHATDPGVFIRSMATRGHLGGLADRNAAGDPRARRHRHTVDPRRDGRRGPGGARDRRRRPTPPWSSSTRAGATVCRRTRRGCSRSPTCSW